MNTMLRSAQRRTEGALCCGSAGSADRPSTRWGVRWSAQHAALPQSASAQQPETSGFRRAYCTSTGGAAPGSSRGLDATIVKYLEVTDSTLLQPGFLHDSRTEADLKAARSEERTQTRRPHWQLRQKVPDRSAASGRALLTHGSTVLRGSAPAAGIGSPTRRTAWFQRCRPVAAPAASHSARPSPASLPASQPQLSQHSAPPHTALIGTVESVRCLLSCVACSSTADVRSSC
jgi:hypothetical protein